MIPDFKTMSLEDKMLTMSALWLDLRETVEASVETPEICRILDNRVARVESGEAELLDWDEVKGSLGRG
jgi:hypothetical protein